jgi:isoleucyl-tRNA synthetase
VLHRLTELDAKLRNAQRTHDWTGVYPEIHAFCASDLSAFYFDIRKDSLYCDARDSLRRRSARTVLDQLHRCLTAWLAPVLVFTAEEAWLARFPDEQDSIHLRDWPVLPEQWQDAALAEKFSRVREARSPITRVLEDARRAGNIGSSLQAKITLTAENEDRSLVAPSIWEELLIVSQVEVAPGEPESNDGILVHFELAPGAKCDRCWRVLPEVGQSQAHPTLCRRCEAVVEGQGG